MSFRPPMTQAQIQYAIEEMKATILIHYKESDHIVSMIPKMEEMSQKNDYATREKLMRWIGFMQGVLWSDGLYSIDELREMNTKELH
jgi:hypothetical protein